MQGRSLKLKMWVYMQVFNVKWVETLMKTATPVSKSYEFREFIEETGYSLSTASNLTSLIPTILARMLMEIVQPLIGNNIFFSIIFDGTTRVAEAFGIVIRWVEGLNFVIIQKLIRISFLALAMTACDTQREMVKVLIQEYYISP